jgi:hypothetical protein
METSTPTKEPTATSKPNPTTKPTRINTPTRSTTPTPIPVSETSPPSTASSECGYQTHLYSCGFDSTGSYLRSGMWLDKGQSINLDWCTIATPSNCTPDIAYYIVSMEGSEICRKSSRFEPGYDVFGQQGLIDDLTCHFKVPDHITPGRHDLWVVPYSSDHSRVDVVWDDSTSRGNFLIVNFGVNP